MDEAAVILTTLIAYKVVLVGIGLWAERRNSSGTDYFLGGRRLGPMVAAISASASSSSGWTLLGVSGAAWKDGLSALWLFPACVGGFVLNWYVLAPAMQRYSHRTGAITVTDILAGQGTRRSRPIATLAALVVLLSLGAYVASQYQAAGKTFHEALDAPLELSILIGAVVVLIYTLLGGFWAVSITDTLQGLVMAATAVVLPIAALIHIGGLTELSTQLSETAPSGFLQLGGPRPMSIAIGATLGLLGIGLGYPGQPHVVNRFMAMREGDKTLVQARRIALTWALVVYAGMLLLGLCGRALFPETLDGEVVFLKATRALFHPLVAGVMIAAVLSAIMSTVDSQLLVAASAVTHDLRLGGPTEKSMLRRSRATVLVLGLVAVGVALAADASIFRNVLFGWSAMGAAFGPALLLRVAMGRVVTAPRMLLLVALGFSWSVTAYLLARENTAVLDPALRWLHAGTIPFLGTFVLGWLLSSPGTHADA
ncbi:MAG: sodium/proline symporter [bacterium]|nr:sodium/proline symporter [bacterium]